MHRPGFLFLIAIAMTAQPPFQANARLGVPVQIGAISRISGSQEVVENGFLRELTLQSAELALTFPNRVENVTAAAGERLLILRGAIRNPEKTSEVLLGPADVIGLRLAAKYTGAGKFQFVSHFDPETLQHIRRKLRSGESAGFVGVWRIPEDFADFRLGVTSEKKVIVAWFDLNPAMVRRGLEAPGTAEAGESLAIDGMEISATGAGEAAKGRYVVHLTTANRMLLPVRWGWQYIMAELVDGAGRVTTAYPDLVDAATGASWVGDVAAGATVRTRLTFESVTGVPGVLRLKMKGSGRRVAWRLGG